MSARTFVIVLHDYSDHILDLDSSEVAKFKQNIQLYQAFIQAVVLDNNFLEPTTINLFHRYTTTVFMIPPIPEDDLTRPRSMYERPKRMYFRTLTQLVDYCKTIYDKNIEANILSSPPL